MSCVGAGPRTLDMARRRGRVLAVAAVTLLAAACSESTAWNDGSVADGSSPPSDGADRPAADADATARASNPDTEHPVTAIAGIRFEHVVVDPDPPPGDGCCLDVIMAGDVDGDGDGDLITGAENAHGLAWYANPGSTGYAPWERHVIGAGDFTTDGRAADIDDDGDLDVVVSAIDRNVLEWWEQTGDPTTEDGWARHDIGPDYAHDLALADIDLDGDLDVGAFHNETQRVEWLAQPDDLRDPWVQHVIDERFGEGFAAGDLDGDGDVDVAAGPAVYLNLDGLATEWQRVPLGDDLPEQTRPRIADVDADGALDVVLAADETEGRLSWFRGPYWIEAVIDPDAGFTHSLEIGDVDGDGNLDLLAGVMHTDDDPTVRVLLGDGGGAWHPVLLTETGTHNAQLADLDGNGLLDVFGKNYDGPKQVEVWFAVRDEAGVASGSPLDGFRYVHADDARERFDDDTAFFGLAFADVDRDGDTDIASGPYVYLTPPDLDGPLERIDVGDQVGSTVDIMLALDVDGDDAADLIATALPDVWWFESDDGRSWSGRVVGSVPATARPNGQGYRTGDLTGDGRPEVVLSGGEGESEVWYLAIPDAPESDEWPATRVTDTATDEQIGIGDIDGDGDADVVAGDMKDGGEFIAWFENPGDGSGDWERHRLGAFPGVYPDRLDAADVDGDGRLDVVVTEEDDGSAPEAEVMWYRQPDDPTADDWERSVVVTQYTTNGLDVVDVDGDGDPDLVTGEHRGDRRLSIWENVRNGGDVSWVEHPVDSGKESHLGARTADLDADGDLDIVSIGFDEPQYLHVWVNE
jgi:hypothetical protein